MGKCPIGFLWCNQIIGTLRELGGLCIQGLLKHPMVFRDLSVNIVMFWNGCPFLLFFVKQMCGLCFNQLPFYE